VNLNTLCKEVVAHLAPFAIEKNIEISLHTPKNDVNISGNFTALSILLRNLIDNGIRYTPEDGSIFVELIDSPTDNILRVTDSGPGIPLEYRSRVFERFFRILGTKVQGSGLGLAIVQQVASLHNATVQLETPPSGQGLQVDVVFSKL